MQIKCSASKKRKLNSFINIWHLLPWSVTWEDTCNYYAVLSQASDSELQWQLPFRCFLSWALNCIPQSLLKQAIATHVRRLIDFRGLLMWARVTHAATVPRETCAARTLRPAPARLLAEMQIGKCIDFKDTLCSSQTERRLTAASLPDQNQSAGWLTLSSELSHSSGASKCRKGRRYRVLLRS